LVVVRGKLAAPVHGRHDDGSHRGIARVHVVAERRLQADLASRTMDRPGRRGGDQAGADGAGGTQPGRFSREHSNGDHATRFFASAIAQPTEGVSCRYPLGVGATIQFALADTVAERERLADDLSDANGHAQLVGQPFPNTQPVR
jgi:hypothetical protein